MKRTLGKLILVALSAFALAACQTAPAKPEPAPVVQKSTTDLLLEIRKAELQLEREEQMAWIKFAAESKSDLAKGFVMGRSAGKGATAAASSTTQTVLALKTQAADHELRKAEQAERNSAFNKGLQLFDRGAQLFMFSKGLSFQKWQIDQSNSQNRYTLDTVRGAQRDGFTAGGSATLGGFGAGTSATLGGLAAGQAAAGGETSSTTAAE